jgi:hypothetical protein
MATLVQRHPAIAFPFSPRRSTLLMNVSRAG